jgi:hypothetical protein
MMKFDVVIYDIKLDDCGVTFWSNEITSIVGSESMHHFSIYRLLNLFYTSATMRYPKDFFSAPSHTKDALTKLI